MIRLIKPYISFKEIEPAFKEIFDSGILTKGKNVNLFRKEIATYTGAKYSFLTTSATTALSLSLKMYNVGPGDEVIVSDFSFPATANVVEDLGAIPIFADVDIDTFNMLPAELSGKITSRTKAVIFVDALGNPSGVTDIKKICKSNGLPLIEDAACAIGSSERGVKCGNIANITCFSFHPRKLLTTGEGGAITIQDDVLAEILDVKLNHGGKVVTNGKWEFVDYGYNYRMSELQAVMGMVQLAKLDEVVKERNIIRDKYIIGLSQLGFKAQQINNGVIHNVQSVVFTVPSGINRDRLIKELATNGIETTIGTYCLSNTDYYRKKYGCVNDNATLLEKKTITLPCFNDVDVNTVVRTINFSLS